MYNLSIINRIRKKKIKVNYRKTFGKNKKFLTTNVSPGYANIKESSKNQIVYTTMLTKI